MPVSVAIRIFSRSAIGSFAIASRSPERTVLNGSMFFNSGFSFTSAPTRLKQYITCEYIGCSTQSVPSWSKVAMRSAGGTNCGLAVSVVTLTKFMIADLAAPPFHEGNGSWARAMVEVNATTPISAATRRFCLYVVFIIFVLFPNESFSLVKSRAASRETARVFHNRTDGLVGSAADARRLGRVHCRHRVCRILKIRHQVGRGAAGEAFDAWILHDRLVEIDEHRIH